MGPVCGLQVRSQVVVVERTTTSLVLAGDVMLGRGVREALETMQPAEPWGDLLPALQAADLRIVNLECAITEHRQRWMRTPKVFHFRGNAKGTEVLRAAGIDAVSLANNHSLDFEVEGLLDTLDALDRAGIARAGAGRDEREAARPAFLRGGVALIACTDNEPPFAAGPTRPGTNYLPVSLEPEILARVEDWIAAARDGGATTVILSNHWGPNMVERPPPDFRRFARAAIDRGVDLWFGHSAHLTQGVELYRGRPILYDTGDFLDDYAVDPDLRNDRSFLFRVELEAGVPRRLELLPVALSFARVSLAVGGEREEILRRMEGLSRDLGTALARSESGLELRW